MEREDHTVVNVLVIENVEIVPDVQTERESVWVSVFTLIVFVCAFYYLLALTMCWLKN
jgi:hypothetical protein